MQLLHNSSRPLSLIRFHLARKATPEEHFTPHIQPIAITQHIPCDCVALAQLQLAIRNNVYNGL
jgi:hypothetical protein